MMEGSCLTPDGAHFVIHSASASAAFLCLFNARGVETAQIAMQRQHNQFVAHVPGIKAGQRYGFRLDGPYDPDGGLFHDPAKLLADPYATRFDRAWRHDPALALPRGQAPDTAPLVPKAVLEKNDYRPAKPPLFQAGGLIYEVNVRGFSMLHSDVSEADRGTVQALAHPSVIAHLKNIGVGAVELMPVTAWIDERHLPPLGLSNAWGYNPIGFMAVDPRLCPGGIADLRRATAALRKAGIGVILDLVFNHSGESDRFGPVISLRGFDNQTYYRAHMGEPGHLINDTGCGNTIQCDHPVVQRLILASLRHFVLAAGVDGFRFDLAPIMGRTSHGFQRDAELLRAISADPVLADRILIAEPWDIGPGGYQLGNFGPDYLEWNDRARDDVRRFWRGDTWTIGSFATRLAGSSDVFARDGETRTRTVNFLAAHDGFTLADMVAYRDKHNEANGEHNRDGHNENHSWNNGAEGRTEDAAIQSRRRADLKALLATLFAMRGSIMLTAGDEFGRTQHGNNNAYAQDNAAYWVDWAARDTALEAHVAALARIRKANPALSDTAFLKGEVESLVDSQWLRPDGAAMQPADWEAPDAGALALLLEQPQHGRLAILFNRTSQSVAFQLPKRKGFAWHDASTAKRRGTQHKAAPRSVSFWREVQP
jgi:glycogen debranching enzyme